MLQMDLSLLTNWVLSGFIGLVFGIISAWITYRYERRRDDISWQREKEKLEKQQENEKVLLRLQFQQRIQELEQQLGREKEVQIREQLVKGLDDPKKTIETLQSSDTYIRGGGTLICVDTSQVSNMAARFAAKEHELEALINDVRSVMSDFEKGFIGSRANRIFSEWEQIESSLNQSLQFVEYAVNFLNKINVELSEWDSRN